MNFLFVGRPTPAKGLPDLLAALKPLTDYTWTLSLCGGPDGAQFADHPSALPLGKVVDLGPRSNALIPELMHASHAVIVPSRYENFCNVALEAMAAGRAVIGSRCGGIPDLVDEGVTGLLYETGVIEELSAALRRALEHPSRLAEMGRNGWHKAQRFCWTRISAESHQLFSSVVQPRAG